MIHTSYTSYKNSESRIIQNYENVWMAILDSQNLLFFNRNFLDINKDFSEKVLIALILFKK